MDQKHKHLDLDTFGEIMDEFIHKNAVGIAVTKEADSDDWKVTGVGLGAVMDFYIFLNALEPIYLEMLEQMNGQMDTEKLAEALSDLMKKSMIEAAKKGA